MNTHGAEQLNKRLHGVVRVDIVGPLWAGMYCTRCPSPPLHPSTSANTLGAHLHSLVQNQLRKQQLLGPEPRGRACTRTEPGITAQKLICQEYVCLTTTKTKGLGGSAPKDEMSCVQQTGVSWNGGGTPREDTEGNMRPKQIRMFLEREREKSKVPSRNVLDTCPVHHWPLKETHLLGHLLYFAKSLCPPRFGCTTLPP